MKLGSVIFTCMLLLSVSTQAHVASPPQKSAIRIPAQALIGAWKLISIDYAWRKARL